MTPVRLEPHTNKNDINKNVWYSISSLVFNPNVGFESKFGIGSELPISVLAPNTRLDSEYQHLLRSILCAF